MRHHDTVFRTILKPVPWFGSALVEHGADAPIAFLLLRLAQVTRAASKRDCLRQWVRAHSCLCEQPGNCSSHHQDQRQTRLAM